MQPDTRDPRRTGNSDATRSDLAWAEVAGLVQVNADGSWSATELARAWLRRAESPQATTGDHSERRARC
jgi:hypothetical protein